jgi:hypothetical protein
MLWTSFANEPGQSVNGGKPLVSSADAAMALLFNVREESTKGFASQIFNPQSVNDPLTADADEGQQQAECVPIALLRVL